MNLSKNKFKKIRSVKNQSRKRSKIKGKSNNKKLSRNRGVISNLKSKSLTNIKNKRNFKRYIKNKVGGVGSSSSTSSATSSASVSRTASTDSTSGTIPQLQPVSINIAPSQNTPYSFTSNRTIKQYKVKSQSKTTEDLINYVQWNDIIKNALEKFITDVNYESLFSSPSINLIEPITSFYQEQANYFINKFDGSSASMQSMFKKKFKAFLYNPDLITSWLNQNLQITIGLKKINFLLLYIILYHMFVIDSLIYVMQTTRPPNAIKIENLKNFHNFVYCLMTSFEYLFMPIKSDKTTQSGQVGDDDTDDETDDSNATVATPGQLKENNIKKAGELKKDLIEQQKILFGEEGSKLWNSGQVFKNLKWGQEEWDSEGNNEVVHGTFISNFIQKMIGNTLSNHDKEGRNNLMMQKEFLHNVQVFNTIKAHLIPVLYHITYSIIMSQNQFRPPDIKGTATFGQLTTFLNKFNNDVSRDQFSFDEYTKIQDLYKNIDPTISASQRTALSTNMHDMDILVKRWSEIHYKNLNIVTIEQLHKINKLIATEKHFKSSSKKRSGTMHVTTYNLKGMGNLFNLMLFFNDNAGMPLVSSDGGQSESLSDYLTSWETTHLANIKKIGERIKTLVNKQVYDSLEFRNGDSTDKAIKIVGYEFPTDTHADSHYEILTQDPNITPAQYFTALMMMDDDDDANAKTYEARLKEPGSDDWQTLELGASKNRPALKKSQIASSATSATSATSAPPKRSFKLPSIPSAIPGITKPLKVPNVSGAIRRSGKNINNFLTIQGNNANVNRMAYPKFYKKDVLPTSSYVVPTTTYAYNTSQNQLAYVKDDNTSGNILNILTDNDMQGYSSIKSNNDPGVDITPDLLSKISQTIKI